MTRKGGGKFSSSRLVDTGNEYEIADTELRGRRRERILVRILFSRRLLTGRRHDTQIARGIREISG